ncbi:hypothetical protein G7Z17_g1985 [Cylindrodendrum hubeiense]|uniref:Ankyrin n=1 Tax=Cylindrodendrum hubeiense TaxID=595255 RepID=A0A9P5HID7_9HYPO|nr:hypothetical protein G7Z17_g1985 [Cylindrodendrum hubeiense]
MGNLKAVRTLLHRGVDPNALGYRRSQDGYDPYKFDEESDEQEENGENDEDDEDDEDEQSDEDSDEENKLYKFEHPIALALHDDMDFRSSDMIYLLIKAGANVTDRWFSRALVGSSLECLSTMFRLGFKVNLTGPTALAQYAMRGLIGECGLLIDAGVDVNAYGVFGRSALQAAADGASMWGPRDGEGDHVALVHYLLERGADVNLPANPHQLTALQAAARGGNVQLVDCLIEAGAKTTAPPAEGGILTLLEAAASGWARDPSNGPERDRSNDERIGIFKKLLAHGAPVNRTNGTDCTVLHQLVRASQMECLELALKAKAAIEGRDELAGNMTPLQTAAALHNMEAMQLLLRHNANINDPASEDFGGRTALQAAIDPFCPYYFRHEEYPSTEETVTLLLQNHAEVNAPAGNQYGRTALQAAVSHKPNAKIVALLLQHGADVNAPPAKAGGVTALQGAVLSGDIQIVRVLLTHNADVNAPAALKKGRTAIEGASEYGRISLVRLLLDWGAMPGARGFSRAIRFAERNQRFDIAELLRGREQACNSLSMGLIDPTTWDFRQFPLDADMVPGGEDENEMQL